MRHVMVGSLCVILFVIFVGNIARGQTFDWRMAYGWMQYGYMTSHQKLRISEMGMVYSRISYTDIPPFQYDTGHVLEKRDQDGHRLWYYNLGGNGRIPLLRFDHDSDENIYLLQERSDSSRTLIKRNQDFGSLWQRDVYGQYENIEVYKDRIYLIAWAWSTPNNAHEISIAQYDTAMSLKWKRQYVYSQDETLQGCYIYIDDEGSIYICGTRNKDEDDVFFIKYDISGALICDVLERGPVGRSERGSGIATSKDGDMYILSTVDNQNDTRSAWITKYSPSGTVVWTKQYETKVSLRMVNIVSAAEKRFFAGGYFGGTQVIFEIDDEGNELWRMPTDVKFTFSLMEIGPGGELYLGEVNYNHESSLAKYTRSSVAVDELAEPENGPVGCALSQNYPNPFNPTTTFDFSIPGSGHVRINAFDRFGREIAVIANGDFPAGPHTCTFYGTGLASGVYTYRLTWNNVSVTRTMVLVR